MTGESFAANCHCNVECHCGKRDKHKHDYRGGSSMTAISAKKNDPPRSRDSDKSHVNTRNDIARD